MTTRWKDRRTVLAWGGAAALAGAVPRSWAQAYPKQPVKLVVPFPPGGPSDQIARIVAEALTASRAMQIVVENKPGAGGALATASVATTAQPDGYTVLFATLGALAIAPHLRKNIGYDPVKDFLPVAHLASLTPVYALNPSVPANDARALAALSRAKPGTVSLGSTGNGSTVHIGIEMFKAAAKADIAHIAYKGAAPAVADALGGQISGLVVDVPAVLPYLKTGRLKAVAVGAPTRDALLPDVPTLKEQGFADVDTPNWAGVLVPAATPPAIHAQLVALFAAALDSPATKERLVRIGAMPSTMRTPGEFAQYIAAEHERWGQRIARFGITGE